MREMQASSDNGTQLSETSESVGSASNPSLSDLYIQARMSIRATDDISLKLLAAIPFVSGSGSRFS